MKKDETVSFTASTKPDGYTLLGIVADSQQEIKTEDCVLESAFLFENGARFIVYSSCQRSTTHRLLKLSILNYNI